MQIKWKTDKRVQGTFEMCFRSARKKQQQSHLLRSQLVLQVLSFVLYVAWCVSSLRDVDVTPDNLRVMMRTVVMVTLPKDTLFHFRVRDDAQRGCCMWDTDAFFQNFSILNETWFYGTVTIRRLDHYSLLQNRVHAVVTIMRIHRHCQILKALSK